MFARLVKTLADIVPVGVKNRLKTAQADVAARAARNQKRAVTMCIWTVAGSFALASLLQLCFGYLRAYHTQMESQQRRADDVVTVVDTTLSRMQATGMLFANGGLAEEAVAALPGMRGVAVSDNGGQALRHSGEAIDMVALTAMTRGQRTVVGAGHSTLIVFHDVDRVIAVAFEPTSLAPAALLKNAEILSPTGVNLAGSAAGKKILTLKTPNWPVSVRVGIRAQDLPAVFDGLTPLYLFGIFAPLGIALWLCRVAEGEIVRRQRIAKLIRALRIAHPRGPKLQLRLAACERRAAETLRAQSALYAKVAREIADPLSAVAGFAEIIETGVFGSVSPPQYGEYAHDIGRGGKMVFAQLAQMQELAALQSGDYAPNPTPCDAVEIAATVIGENASRAFLRRIWLEMVPAHPVPAMADAAAVGRILRALIANALRRTPKGGRIRIQVAAQASDAVIVVEDTGRPYDRTSERVLPRRAATRRAWVETPSNLDLAIAAELARVLGGSLNFTQSPGAGCRAELRLALADVADMPHPPATHHTGGAAK